MYHFCAFFVYQSMLKFHLPIACIRSLASRRFSDFVTDLSTCTLASVASCTYPYWMRICCQRVRLGGASYTFSYRRCVGTALCNDVLGHRRYTPVQSVLYRVVLISPLETRGSFLQDFGYG